MTGGEDLLSLTLLPPPLQLSKHSAGKRWVSPLNLADMSIPLHLAEADELPSHSLHAYTVPPWI